MEAAMKAALEVAIETVLEAAMEAALEAMLVKDDDVLVRTAGLAFPRESLFSDVSDAED